MHQRSLWIQLGKGSSSINLSTPLNQLKEVDKPESSKTLIINFLAALPKDPTGNNIKAEYQTSHPS